MNAWKDETYSQHLSGKLPCVWAELMMNWAELMKDSEVDLVLPLSGNFPCWLGTSVLTELVAGKKNLAQHLFATYVASKIEEKNKCYKLKIIIRIKKLNK